MSDFVVDYRGTTTGRTNPAARARYGAMDAGTPSKPKAASGHTASVGSTRSSASTSPALAPRAPPGISPPAMALVGSPASSTGTPRLQGATVHVLSASSSSGTPLWVEGSHDTYEAPAHTRRHSTLVLSEGQRRRLHTSMAERQPYDPSCVGDGAVVECKTPLDPGSHPRSPCSSTAGSKPRLRHGAQSAEDLSSQSLSAAHRRQERASQLYHLLQMDTSSPSSPIIFDRSGRGTPQLGSTGDSRSGNAGATVCGPSRAFETSLAGMTDSIGPGSSSVSLRMSGNRQEPPPQPVTPPPPPLQPSSVAQTKPSPSHLRKLSGSSEVCFTAGGSASYPRAPSPQHSGPASPQAHKPATKSRIKSFIPPFLTPSRTRASGGEGREDSTSSGSASRSAVHVVEQRFRAPTPPQRHTSPPRGGISPPRWRYPGRRERQSFSVASASVEASLEGSLSEEKRVHFALPPFTHPTPTATAAGTTPLGTPANASVATGSLNSSVAGAGSQMLAASSSSSRGLSSTPESGGALTAQQQHQQRMKQRARRKGSGEGHAGRDTRSPHHNLPAFTPEDELCAPARHHTQSPAAANAASNSSLEASTGFFGASSGSSESPSVITAPAPAASELELSVRRDGRRNVLLLAPKLHANSETGSFRAAGVSSPSLSAIPSTPLGPSSFTTATAAATAAPDSPGARAYNPMVHPLRPAIKLSPTYAGGTSAAAAPVTPQREKLGPVLVAKMKGLLEGMAKRRRDRDASLGGGAGSQGQRMQRKKLASKERERFVRVVLVAIIVVGSVLALLL